MIAQYEKYLLIPYADRAETPILIFDDIIVINFIMFFERDYSVSGTDQLIYQLHKIGQNKNFIFLFDDGANIAMTNALPIISNIVKTFNLTKDSCAVICRHDITIPNVTVIVEESINLWIKLLYPIIKDIPIPIGPFDKKFAVWFNRGTFYRLIIVKHLYTCYKEISYISYQEPGMISQKRFDEFFQDEINWARENTPIMYDQGFPNRVYNHEMIVGSSRKPYDNYFLEIVVETDCITTEWITEKTIKNLYIGKPFIIMGASGILDKLKRFGFKTFSPWIDESYDDIENNYLRLEAIKQEIDQLSKIDINDLYQKLLPILNHNRETYVKYINSRR
jgi:hypothetical protein